MSSAWSCCSRDKKDYEGRPPVRDIGCAGTIAEYQQLPDGRYVILLRGLTTFRVLSEDQRKPYRLAKCRRCLKC